jgi:cellulose synthase/poly-beta-1,6-N-acetylglucosamine synthase-like glycosyltransferase/putative flippase GtrA
VSSVKLQQPDGRPAPVAPVRTAAPPTWAALPALSFAAAGGIVALLGLGVMYILVDLLSVGQRNAFALQLPLMVALTYLADHFVTWRGSNTSALRRLPRFTVIRGTVAAFSWLYFSFLMSSRWGGSRQYLTASALCFATTTYINYLASGPLTASRPLFSQRRWVRDQRGSTVATRARWVADRARLKHPVRAILGVLLVVLGLITSWYGGFAGFSSLLVLFALFNCAMSSLELTWRLYGWRTPEALKATRFLPPVPVADSTLSFSLIVPALREEAVIGQTLERLCAQSHPRVEILVSLCDNDYGTIEAAQVVAARHSGRVRVITAAYARPNKPRQLNTALAYCSGDFVGVIDSEDDVATELLLHIEALCRAEDADVVQGGVQLMNLGDGLKEWFCVHNVLEYFFWFTSRMFFQVRSGFVPLGGNTVFVRRSLLEEAGGWPDNLTEDCALGVLLCTQHGAKVVAAYDPQLATREETPPTIDGLRRQRTRWDQGFLSVLMDGGWRRLPTFRQRFLAWYILATPFVQAFSGLLLPISLLTYFVLKEPVGVVLLMYAPFVPISFTLVLQCVGLHEFSRAYEQKPGLRHYISLLVGSYPYQLLLMVAALMAVFRHATGRTDWQRTTHIGRHREPLPTAGLPELEAAVS